MASHPFSKLPELASWVGKLQFDTRFALPSPAAPIYGGGVARLQALVRVETSPQIFPATFTLSYLTAFQATALENRCACGEHTENQRPKENGAPRPSCPLFQTWPSLTCSAQETRLGTFHCLLWQSGKQGSNMGRVGSLGNRVSESSSGWLTDGPKGLK